MGGGVSTVMKKGKLSIAQGGGIPCNWREVGQVTVHFTVGSILKCA